MNYNLVFFVNGETWDHIYDCPSFTFRPIKQVANYYETTIELIKEAFQKWIEAGFPEEYLHPIGEIYTLKKHEPRKLFIRIFNSPGYFYGQGYMNLEVQWGEELGKTRSTEHRFTSFSLESILTSDKRSTDYTGERTQ